MKELDNMNNDSSGLWDTEYKNAGIPSSNRQRPSNVVVDFLNFVSNQLHAESAALDIGAGQGRNSFFLTRRGFSVTALDYSEKAISELRSAAAEEQLELNSLVQDVGLPWQVDSASQNLCIDAFCFKHVIEETGIANYTSELWRVLKPGAWFMLFLASRLDGYYRQFPTSEQNGPGIIIRDPGNGIRSRLYDESDVRSLFSNFEIISASKKSAKNEMHGQVYDRESLIFYLRKAV